MIDDREALAREMLVHGGQRWIDVLHAADIALEHIAATRAEALENVVKVCGWIKEVHPENTAWGAARVEITWSQWNAMREMMGLKQQRPGRALARGTEIARLRAALEDVRKAIVEADPEVLTDVLWIVGGCPETAVDRIDAVLEPDS
jgi:hypothetical protein